jgi:hypothetical protein
MIFRGWQVLLDSFHVYTYRIGDLLPGNTVLQHSETPLHNLSSHHPETVADTPLFSLRISLPLYLLQ